MLALDLASNAIAFRPAVAARFHSRINVLVSHSSDKHETANVKNMCKLLGEIFRAVAQLGRAPGSGPGGRGFKSHQPDELISR